MVASLSQQQEERIWLEKALAGDADAFGKVVTAYQGPVYNLCYRMLGDQTEAEDATQETFLRAYTHLHYYDRDRKFLNWVLSVASNHCIDRLRRRRIQWQSLDDSPYLEQVPAVGESPQHAAERRDEARRIQQYLNRLAPEYRLPLVLLYWQEYSYEEIAAALHLSVPAVKSRLHRARKQVAEFIMAEAATAAAATAAARKESSAAVLSSPLSPVRG